MFDLVYVPAETPLVAAARARGLRAANGSEMLIAQAAIAFERWTGVGGMADVMRDGRGAAPRRPDGPGLTPCAWPRSSSRGGRGRPSCATTTGSSRSTRGRPGSPASEPSLPAVTAALDRLRAWLDAQPAEAGRPLDAVTLGPAVPDPGAIYTVGLNYDGPGASPRPERPLIYGKAAASVAGHGATLAWDRDVTDDVDAEVELGVVIGAAAFRVTPAEAMRHVFGYTCINDVSARDERLDGDQWLLGKSMPGFCPVGPWIVTADAFDPANVAPPLHDRRRADPGRPHLVDALRHPGDRRLPQPAPRAAAGRPHRDRHAGPADHAARTRTPPAGRRYRDRLDRGDRTR